MAEVSPTGFVAMDSDIKVYMYTSPYIWSTATEVDITDQVFRSGSSITLQVNTDHMAKLKLRNHVYKFLDTTSDYHLLKGTRIKITFNGFDMKFVVNKPPVSISDDAINVELSCHSSSMRGHVAQVRVSPADDGNVYLEDVLFRALFDTGLHNHFVIKDIAGNIYDVGASNLEKTSMKNTGQMIYWDKTVREILDDLCARSGRLWYITDIAGSDHASYINIVDIDSDYEAPTSKIIYLSAYDNLIDIDPVSDPQTVINYIFIENLGTRLFDEDSIDQYEMREPLILLLPQGADPDEFIQHCNKYLYISKDPETTVTYTCSRFIDIGNDLDKLCKTINESGTHDTASGFNRKYRLLSITYSLSGENTIIIAGTLARSKKLKRIEEFLNGDIGVLDENTSRRLTKGGTVRLQVDTDIDKISSLIEADTINFKGVRLGVDYLYQATVSPNSKFYMDNDGVRNGN